MANLTDELADREIDRLRERATTGVSVEQSAARLLREALATRPMPNAFNIKK